MRGICTSLSDRTRIWGPAVLAVVTVLLGANLMSCHRDLSSHPAASSHAHVEREDPSHPVPMAQTRVSESATGHSTPAMADTGSTSPDRGALRTDLDVRDTAPTPGPGTAGTQLDAAPAAGPDCVGHPALAGQVVCPSTIRTPTSDSTWAAAGPAITDATTRPTASAVMGRRGYGTQHSGLRFGRLLLLDVSVART